MKIQSKTDWERLEKMNDTEIDYSDIPETDEDFWSDAKVVKHRKKVDLTLHLDEDIALWLSKLEGYSQTVNSILSNYFNTINKLTRQHKSHE